VAVMIWFCVFPTLPVINIALGDWPRSWPPCCARSCSSPRGPESSTGGCHSWTGCGAGCWLA